MTESKIEITARKMERLPRKTMDDRVGDRHNSDRISCIDYEITTTCEELCIFHQP